MYSVKFSGRTIKTMVTVRASVIRNWIHRIRWVHRRRKTRLIVGLKLEWKPNFVEGVVNKVALLLLCVGSKCLIVQLTRLNSIPQALVRFLTDPNITFVAVRTQQYFNKLSKDYGLRCSKYRKLAPLAADKLGRDELRRAGLNVLASVILDLDVGKPRRIATSDWSCRWLTLEQIRYACIDVRIFFEIGLKLMGRNQSS